MVLLPLRLHEWFHSTELLKSPLQCVMLIANEGSEDDASLLLLVHDLVAAVGFKVGLGFRGFEGV